MFEQVKLPQSIDYINVSNISKMKENILGTRELAAADVIINNLIGAEKVYATGNENELWEFIDKKRSVYGLEDNNIVDISMEILDANTSTMVKTIINKQKTINNIDYKT